MEIDLWKQKRDQSNALRNKFVSFLNLSWEFVKNP